MSETNNTLVILGMHRSGTSLTARWLNLMGMNLGDSLLGENFSNKNGHFEDSDFLNLHEDLLEGIGEHRWGLNLRYETHNLSGSQINKIQDLCAKKNRSNNNWGFKEPRTCLFSRYYDKILCNPFYIIVYRSPVEVADSLVRREVRRIENKYKNQTLLGRMKIYFKKQKEIKFEKNKLMSYLNDWRIYNEQLIQLIEKTNNDYILVHIKSLPHVDQEIFNLLHKKGVSELTFKPLSTIYNSTELKSKNEDNLPEEVLKIYNRLNELQTLG